MTQEHGEGAPAPKPAKGKKQAILDALSLIEEPVEPDESFASVKEQSLDDPQMGEAIGFWPPDSDDPSDVRWIEPGEWRFHSDLINPESELPHNIPVQALGVGDDGLSYYYFNTLGHVVKLKGDSGKGMFELLFAGRSRYLNWLFPRFNKDGHVVGWEADDLKRALTDWAGWCGTFDDEDSVRGRGMWRDDHGGAVFHAGDAVLIDGKWCKPGRYGRYIYPARKFTGRPKRHRDLKAVGAKVLGIYQTWAWERPELDPVLQLGWIITAKMGGALFRRPFIWVTGPKGSGKSYLQKFDRCLMHGALLASSNATPAAMYQKLGKDSIPVLIDEQESKADTTVTDRLLDLMRVAYSGDSLDRGDKDGKAKSYTVQSAFLASSIAKPAMEASDESRMALLSLRKPDVLPTESAYDEKEAYRMGQALTQRAIDWFPRWEALLDGVDKALRSKPGHESRSLDTFAPLIAGYHVAMFDDMPTAAQYAQYADLVDPKNLNELQGQEEDWERCLRHLLNAVPETLKHNKQKSIGQVLNTFMKGGSTDTLDVDEKLSGFKVCVTWKKLDDHGQPLPKEFKTALLFIPNSDPMLHQLFTGTAWSGRLGGTGPWNGVLKQAPRHLWIGDITSSKGGFSPSKGIAFRLVDLWNYFGGGRDDAPKDVAGPMFEPSPFDDPEDHG